MPHGFGLRETGQTDLLALQAAEARREGFRLIEIDTGDLGAAELEDQRFLDAERPIAREGFRRGRERRDGLSGTALPVHASTSFRAFTKAARSSSVLTSVDATMTRLRSSDSFHSSTRGASPPSTRCL